MIITITDKNAHLYNALFAKAYKDCKEKGVLRVPENEAERFLSLNDYFAHMGELISFNKPEYLMLPLDEEPFKINANSRTIDTKKIVTLQNDQIAETVIFIIDRYYDAMDLCNATAYVQWTLPDGKEGATKIELIDADFEPGKIRFGWPLDDEITSQVGQVKYSVRFWVKNETNDKVVYSFNTLSSAISISPSLQININDIDDVNQPVQENIFSKAIRNSNVIGKGIPQPLNPTFGEPGLNLPITASLKNDTLTLKAQAITGDTGAISYEWYYSPAEENIINGKNFVPGVFYPYNNIEAIEGTINGFNAFGGSVDNVFEEVENLTELNPIELYYVEDTSTSPISYKPYTEYNIPADGTKLYQRFTTYTVPMSPKKVTGRYMVKAKNTIIPNVSREEASQVCSLISPEEIIYKRDLEDRKIVGETILIDTQNQKNGALLSYEWYKDISSATMSSEETINNEKNNYYTPTEPGWYRVKTTASLNREDKNKFSNICKVTFSAAKYPLTLEHDIDTAEGWEYDEDGTPECTAVADIELKTKITNIVPTDFSDYSADLFSDYITYKWQVQEPDLEFRDLTENDISNQLVLSSNIYDSILKVNGRGSTRRVYRCVATNHLGDTTQNTNVIDFVVV